MLFFVRSRVPLVSLYPLLFAVSFAACQDDYKIIKEDAREKGANIRLNDFTRTSTKVAGQPEWKVESKEAYIFQKEGQESNIIAYDFKFSQFDSESGKVSSTLTAERGEIDYVEQKLRLSGGVLYKSAGQVIETETMEFDIETEIVSSNDHVKITEGSSVTRCRKGVVVDKANERQVCKSPVGLSISVPGSGPDDGGGSGGIDIFQ